ncbi:hypothetical protein ABHD89_002434 [Salinicoccus halitifaciens]|uniref:Uncharacterized protein n=1 Tax=Salinicoccus halitifaciens TaxID=1073415 RepID=A0ABV2EC51_9STAP
MTPPLFYLRQILQNISIEMKLKHKTGCIKGVLHLSNYVDTYMHILYTEFKHFEQYIHV